jgi:hypothetical protein
MHLELTDYREKGRPAVFEARESPAPAYKGAERRREHRRHQTDRRTDLRFELQSSDRRVSAGRRAEDKYLKFW